MQRMTEKVVPMIHVPDVAATVDWYRRIGFKLLRQNEEDGEVNWASLSFGSTEVMLDCGGSPSAAHRREADLYVHANGIDDLYQRLKDNVEVLEEPHDTFYGMREFVIRDLNGFWLTFGQPAVA
jgi:uncharacterized glyoxalase superfamily protein PhnB